jgi:hypothetical protein
MNTLRASRRAWSGRSGQRGLSLIECIVYIGLLMIVVGMASVLFFRGLDGFRALRTYTEDMAAALNLGEAWRADLRTATATPQVQTDSAATVMQLVTPDGPVTWRFDGFTVVRDDQRGELTKRVLPRVLRSEFHRDTREGVVAWRWELELRKQRPDAPLAPLFTFITVAPQELKP